MKGRKPSKVDTIEKLAQLVAEGFSDVESRFDGIDSRFDRVEAELELIKRTLERIDTRLAALELAVFGASGSGGGRIVKRSILERLSKLEDVVFNK